MNHLFEVHDKIIYPLCWLHPVRLSTDSGEVLITVPPRASLHKIKAALFTEFGYTYPETALEIYRHLHA